jgi:hypothetical protein
VITLKKTNISYEHRAITLRSDNIFHMPREICIEVSKAITFLHSVEAVWNDPAM